MRSPVRILSLWLQQIYSAICWTDAVPSVGLNSWHHGTALKWLLSKAVQAVVDGISLLISCFSKSTSILSYFPMHFDDRQDALRYWARLPVDVSNTAVIGLATSAKESHHSSEHFCSSGTSIITPIYPRTGWASRCFFQQPSFVLKTVRQAWASLPLTSINAFRSGRIGRNICYIGTFPVECRVHHKQACQIMKINPCQFPFIKDLYATFVHAIHH